MEVFFVNFEVVVGVGARSSSVVATGMFVDELAVYLLVWVLVGSHEKHVFQIVGKSLSFKRILHRPNMHINSCTSNITVFIVYQQASHLIGELNESELTFIDIWLH